MCISHTHNFYHKVLPLSIQKTLYSPHTVICSRSDASTLCSTYCIRCAFPTLCFPNTVLSPYSTDPPPLKILQISSTRPGGVCEDRPQKMTFYAFFSPGGGWWRGQRFLETPGASTKLFRRVSSSPHLIYMVIPLRADLIE